jgi:CDP-diacylglycerol--serine O-phosphatidyltransferase
MDSGHILYSVRKADVVTLGNATLGFFSILFLMRGNFDVAAILVMFAAIADGVDGAVSRRGSFGPLGKNLDSLSDALSFGFVPAVASYLLLESLFGVVASVFSILFLSCGLLRLARFNVSASDNFQGIPITAAGLIVMIFLMQRGFSGVFPYLLMFLLVLLSLLMVSRVEYPKVRDLRVVGLLALFMFFTVVVYAFRRDVVHVFAGVLLVMLLSYIIAPTIGFPREKNPQEA